MKTDAQNNIGWPHTFSMSVPAPAIDKRIFANWTELEEFLGDSTCIEGLVLRLLSGDDTHPVGLYMTILKEGVMSTERIVMAYELENLTNRVAVLEGANMRLA